MWMKNTEAVFVHEDEEQVVAIGARRSTGDTLSKPWKKCYMRYVLSCVLLLLSSILTIAAFLPRPTHLVLANSQHTLQAATRFTLSRADEQLLRCATTAPVKVTMGQCTNNTCCPSPRISFISSSPSSTQHHWPSTRSHMHPRPDSIAIPTIPNS